MEQTFDGVARDYDAQFTDTSIGKAQRARVWQSLRQSGLAGGDKPLRILELSCGTGEDACRFAAEGHEVLATDASETMVAVAAEKAKKRGQSIKTLHCSIEEVASRLEGEQFDLIFSNFGGFNGLNRESGWPATIRGLQQLLKPDGKVVLVIMSRFCLWESWYFFLKLKWGSMFRRSTKKAVKVSLGPDEFFDTWYYSPRDLKNLLKADFNKKKTRPIGFFIPPSYLEPFFQKRPRLLGFLARWERAWGNAGFLSAWSDHFYVEFEKVK